MDKKKGSSPKVPAVRESRRHSPWPFVIVAGLPIISALLRLPPLVTLAVLVIGTVLLLFSPHLAGKRAGDPNKAWFQLMATCASLQSAHAALQQTPANADLLQRFAKLHSECVSLLNGRSDSEWGANLDYVVRIRSEMAEMSVPDKVAAKAPAPQPATAVQPGQGAAGG